jgi:hypothetical protein
VIHESLLAAVHVHPFTADTLTVGPMPPPGPAAKLLGVIEYVQAGVDGPGLGLFGPGFGPGVLGPGTVVTGADWLIVAT